MPLRTDTIYMPNHLFLCISVFPALKSMYFFHNIFFKSNYLEPSGAVSASLKEAKPFDPSTY